MTLPFGFLTRVTGAAGLKPRDKWRTDFRVSPATVLDEISQGLAKSGETCPVNDVPTSAFAPYELCASQNGEMVRKSVVRHPQSFRDVACGETSRLGRDEEAKNLEPGRLGQAAQSVHDTSSVHMSGYMDALLQLCDDCLPSALCSAK